MSNQAAFDRLDRLRKMSQERPGTSGYSLADLEAIQMAVDVLDLLVYTDRSHEGNLIMLHTADSTKPKTLVIGRNEKHYGETCFECFVKAAKNLQKLKSQADERSFNRRSPS